jgi:hypothetical protein
VREDALGPVVRARARAGVDLVLFQVLEGGGERGEGRGGEGKREVRVEEERKGRKALRGSFSPSHPPPPRSERVFSRAHSLSSQAALEEEKRAKGKKETVETISERK